MTTTYNRLKDEQQKELLALIQVSADFATIRTMMYQKFKIIISDTTIDFARKRFMRDTLRTLGIDPGHSSCDRLLSYFKCRKDLSFISVTHAVDSGFVTMRKYMKDTIIRNISSGTEVENKESINPEELKSWRDSLKVDDGKRILVALAWMHNDQHRKILMYPEVLSADVTFGVCKEDRNLLRVCGVDGDLKVFETMNCFMPSKQFRAYDWAISVAFPKLVGQNILPYNSIFKSDQEMALAHSIRKLINSDKIRNLEKEYSKTAFNSSHRFDMFHIFIKEWRNKVSKRILMSLLWKGISYLK